MEMDDPSGPSGLLIGAFVGLVGLSGLFSGLTLGLMGLDLVSLQIIVDSGGNNEAKWAKSILPLRERGNWLLCTLLLGNVLVNVALTQVSDTIFDFGVPCGQFNAVATLTPTMIIFLFGEIIPQAVLNRYGLWFGAKTRYLLILLGIPLAPVAYPMSLALDWALGREVGTLYKRKELSKLLALHGDLADTDVTKDETYLLTHALDFSQKKVDEVMCPLKSVYSLSVTDRLDVETLTRILESGHSRVPVWEDRPENLKHVLLVKDLALIDPDDATPVSTVVTFYGRDPPQVPKDMNLDDCLRVFKTGRGHLAIVQEPDSNGAVAAGIITLEDVVEELIGDEILDETDVYVHVEKGDKVTTRKAFNYRWKRTTVNKLSEPEAKAVSAYLAKDVPAFSPATMNPFLLERVVQGATVVWLKPPDQPGDSKLPAVSKASQPSKVAGERETVTPPGTTALYLYHRGSPAEFFTLVLEGFLEIKSGAEGFTAKAGTFSPLAVGALSPGYVSDFTATVVEPVKLLKITRAQYEAALKAAEIRLGAATPSRRLTVDSSDGSGRTRRVVRSRNNSDVGASPGGIRRLTKRKSPAKGSPSSRTAAPAAPPVPSTSAAMLGDGLPRRSAPPLPSHLGVTKDDGNPWTSSRALGPLLPAQSNRDQRSGHLRKPSGATDSDVLTSERSFAHGSGGVDPHIGASPPSDSQKI